MTGIILDIIKKAKQNMKTIILPEASDERVLKAANIIVSEKIANIILIGNKIAVTNKAKKLGIDVSKTEIIDPLESENYEKFVKFLYELRKEKGMTLEKATELVKDPVYFAVLMLKQGLADGVVSGAIHSTADTLRPALQIIKTAPGQNIVSAFFLMDMPNSKYEKAYIFSDCGLVPNPSTEELCQIAISSNDTCKLLIGKTPKVAMLSYSTHGSAHSESIDKVVMATEMVKTLREDILIDGELQLDAAIVKEVADLKAPNSNIAGSANVLIFPNLDAGNIGYKLVERFGSSNAYGPITQGLDKPVNDLSRGCKAEDIVGAVAITAVQASLK